MKKRSMKDDVDTVCTALARIAPSEGAELDAMSALERIRKKAVRGEKMAKILRGMFDDGVLDPHPTSDDAAEHKLRTLSGWVLKLSGWRG